MTEYDKRFKRLSDKPTVILINNYKCGFSSSNLLAHSIASEIRNDDTVILFYRNIFLRAISVFINWCITDDRYMTQDGWLLKKVQNQLGETEYDRFLDYLRADEVSSAFALYLDTLDQIYMRNWHTLSQVSFIERYKINRIDHLVDLESSIEFTRLTNITFPYDKKNRSDSEIKKTLTQQLLETRTLQDRLRAIYRHDLEYFSNFDIDIASLRPLHNYLDI